LGAPLLTGFASAGGDPERAVEWLLAHPGAEGEEDAALARRLMEAEAADRALHVAKQLQRAGSGGAVETNARADFGGSHEGAPAAAEPTGRAEAFLAVGVPSHGRLRH
jgi:hypothetical protein